MSPVSQWGCGTLIMVDMPSLSPTGNNITLPGITEAQRHALAGPILHDATVSTSLGGGQGEGETVDLQSPVLFALQTPAFSTSTIASPLQPTQLPQVTPPA